MSRDVLFTYLLWSWIALAVVIWPVLLFISAPYGRHARRGWGPTIPDRWGWMVMEAPSPLIVAACFLLGDAPRTVTSAVFLLMWQAHYVHRAFIYPLHIRSNEQRMPVSVVGMAFAYNLVNGYLNGHYLFSLSGGYPRSWLSDVRFILGAGLFVAGYLINRRADATLRSLREPGESGYRIPHGGLYRWVSCPNYLGEIVEWVGWAVATWSLPGAAFAAWTVVNLAPRARSHHRWYQERFPDYPEGRKALMPRLW
ncbi:MAG: DUF1295 domain-containing protein [Anaerolineae bacterium]|nr:DUF1295 domain-containing protein [Anaerolineae bacterium]